MIHIEYGDSGASSFGLPDNFVADAGEMFRLSLATRVIKRCHTPCSRIDPGEVRSLVGIAEMTGEREVFQ